jgi:hypothetical protein
MTQAAFNMTLKNPPKSPTGSPVSVSQTRAELSLNAMRMWRPIPGRGIGCTRSGLDRPKIG